MLPNTWNSYYYDYFNHASNWNAAAAAASGTSAAAAAAAAASSSAAAAVAAATNAATSFAAEPGGRILDASLAAVVGDPHEVSATTDGISPSSGAAEG